MLKSIAVVKAAEMPFEVIEYCVEELDTSTHYQNDIVFVRNDDNPLAKWLYDGGYEFSHEEGDWIGIFAT